MKPLKSIISRVRWNVVLGIIVTILIVVLFAVVLVTMKPLESGQKCKKDICISSRADPSTINLRDESTVWVEVKNSGPDELRIDVNLETYDPKLTFISNSNQTVYKEIKIGPGESRKLDFPARINAMYGGDYRIDVTVSYSFGQIEDKVTLNVKDNI